MHLALPEGVHALRLPEEQDLHLFFLRILIDELCKRLVNFVVLVRDVAAQVRLQLRVLVDQLRNLVL